VKILFVHQNFPGQYGRLAAALAQRADCQVVALGERKNITNRPTIPGVRLGGYASPKAPAAHTHRYVRPLEGAVYRGQAVVRACLDLKNRGFVPDVIYAHPGWGEALFLKDVFPDARLTLYCEFYYHARDHDVGFDPEYPCELDDELRVRIKNATSLLSLAACDSGISPTQWQHQTFPAEFRERISVVHEGIDTDLVRPDAAAELVLKDRGLTLTRDDQVVTYIARNLEPYRGFHVLMRALPAIQKRHPRAHIVIVGDEGVSYSPALAQGQTYKQKLLDEVGARLDMSRIHFLGRVPYATLLRVYQVSSVHVYLTYPFVLSWSLLEAMSAGCAVVASRTAPVEEVIHDGGNGYLVDFFDTTSLAARVGERLDDGKSPARDEARRTIIERFDMRSLCLPRHLELLGLAPGPAN
jgi:glycosyltransferase involved in cell wall biosynthesis